MNCKNHPDRQAESFCFSCGMWYCAECLHQLSPMPLCSKCANLRGDIRTRDVASVPAGVLGPLLQGKFLAVGVAIPVIAFAVLGAFVSSYFFLPAAAVLVIDGAIALKVFGSRRRRSSRKITDAQVFALLRNGHNDITAKRLATATGFSIEDARVRLNQLTVEGVLQVNSSDTELHYQATDVDRIN